MEDQSEANHNEVLSFLSTRSVTIQEPLKKSSSNTRKRGTGTTGLTEIIEDLSMLDPGSPMILDTEDPENHGEVRTGSGANEGGKARPRTVNDKLRQARNFLSHEDANRHVDFARRHAKIDKFLQLIAKERADCDVPLYNEVQAMVQVHQSRMNRQKPQITERPDNTSRQSQSDRLSLFDTSKQGHLLGAPLREDHPPFTLERPVDQNLFIKALHGLPAVGQFEASEVKNRRVELQDNEHRGFLDTLKNPSLIHEWIEGRESQTRDERFNARATRRGRRRAAVQMALRSFATNCEQHYEGRWDRSDFRLPAPPVPQKSGEKIVFDKTITAQNDLKKPFSWTHKYQQFLRAQRNRPQGGKDGSLQEFARPLNGNQPISTEKQAMDLLRAEIRKESQENKHRLESTNDKDWASPASKTGVKKPYFSLNRWSGPAPKSTAEKQTQTSETRPENVATPSPLEVGRNSLVQGNSQGQGNSHIQEGSQRDKSLLEIARSQEKLFRGDAAFTFAETPFLQTVKSKFGSGTEIVPCCSLIKTELIDPGKSRDTKASKHIQLPSIKFSLPEPAYTPKEGWCIFPHPPPLPQHSTASIRF